MKIAKKIGRFQQISHFLGFLQFFCPCFLLINCQILIVRSNRSPKYNRIPNFFYFSICLVAKFSYILLWLIANLGAKLKKLEIFGGKKKKKKKTNGQES